MMQMNYLASLAILILVASQTDLAAGQDDEKSAVEATVRSSEEAMQAFDFAKADSLLAPGAKWIERSYPESAYFSGQGFWAQAKAAMVRVVYQVHDFDVHIRGDVAWVTLIIDGTFGADNEAARALLAQLEVTDTGRTSLPNQREWRSNYVESIVLVKTTNGWRIALGHTSRLPEKEK